MRGVYSLKLYSCPQCFAVFWVCLSQHLKLSVAVKKCFNEYGIEVPTGLSPDDFNGFFV